MISMIFIKKQKKIILIHGFQLIWQYWEKHIEYFKKEKYDNIPQALNDAIQYANLQIIGFANANPEFKGMGTTACIVILKDKDAYIAHVGDSRIYLYLGKEKQLHRITKDHSYVQTLVDAGRIQDDEAEHHPNKNRILKALGIRPEMTPTVDIVQPKNGDVFLICTDGLNGMISDKTIEQVLIQEMSIEKKGELLINLAMQGEPGYPGGQDNCTLELIKIDNSPWQNSAFTSYNPKKQAKLNENPIDKFVAGRQQPSKKILQLSPKKIALVLVPLLVVLACLIAIPVVKENKNENIISEYENGKLISDGIKTIIIGRPNVGKSTLLNKLVGKKVATVGNKPGVTKAQQWVRLNKDLDLLDTPGVLWPKFEDEKVGIHLALTGAIKDELLRVEDLGSYLLDFIKEKYPNEFSEKYNVDISHCGCQMVSEDGKDRTYFYNT